MGAAKPLARKWPSLCRNFRLVKRRLLCFSLFCSRMFVPHVRVNTHQILNFSTVSQGRKSGPARFCHPRLTELHQICTK